MYVDDILIVGNDGERQKLLNIHLANEVEIKTLEKMKYFMEIEVTHSKKRIFISQQKYIFYKRLK